MIEPNRIDMCLCAMLRHPPAAGRVA